MAVDAEYECAATLLDTFHLVRRAIGTEMNKRSPELSMQQFRAMKIIRRNNGQSLSHLSEHLGATISGTSKMIDVLVDRGYIQRETSADDRRKLTLALTQAGEKVLESVHMEAISCLAGRLTSLSHGERAMLNLAMDLLRSTLTPAGAAAEE